MIANIAGRITSFFITKGVIEGKEKEIFKYSFEMTIAFLTNLFIVFFLAVITGNMPVSIWYLVGFMPLRITGGGYHAKNHFRCMIILIAVYVSFLFCINCYPNTWRAITAIIIVIPSSLIIFLLAPLEDENHPLIERQKKRLKIKTVVLIILSNFFIVVGYLGKVSGNFLFAFAAGYLTVTISMLAGAYKNGH